MCRTQSALSTFRVNTMDRTVTDAELQSTGPNADEFAGESYGQITKRLFNATRPKFYPASVLPVVAGTAWGFMVAGTFDWYVFVLALFATICVHASANVLNDVGDESGGTDRINEERIYPYTGGSRFIQAGIMSASAMARLGISLIAIAASGRCVPDHRERHVRALARSRWRAADSALFARPGTPEFSRSRRTGCRDRTRRHSRRRSGLVAERGFRHERGLVLYTHRDVGSPPFSLLMKCRT